MALKMLGFGELAKWIIIGVIAITLLAFFMIGFGKWFIPLLMVLIVSGFLLLSGAYKQAPLYQTMTFILVAFFLTYAIQALPLMSLQMMGYEEQHAQIISGVVAILVTIPIMVTLITASQGKR